MSSSGIFPGLNGFIARLREVNSGKLPTKAGNGPVKLLTDKSRICSDFNGEKSTEQNIVRFKYSSLLQFIRVDDRFPSR